MMTKESETEFYWQISGNGILPVISSWALIKQTMRSTWQKELFFMDQNSQNQLQVDHERSAFHLIKAGNGTFQK